jgi:hypothetical protein
VVGITWIYCPGHAGVCGNEEVDRLAVLELVGGQLLHDKREAIRALWDKVWRESKDTENVYVDRMRLMRETLEDIHLFRGRLGEYLIR